MAIALTVILILSMIVAGVFVRSAYRMPVSFRNLDEERAVYRAALWAAKELNIDRKDLKDPRLRYSLSLWMYSGGRLNMVFMGSIPVAELAILAPFIVRMIDHKGPPQNLPVEYKDEDPEILGRFKKRMDAEGLWPEVRDDRTRSQANAD